MSDLNFAIVPMQPKDSVTLASSLRDEDRREIESAGINPVAGVDMSYTGGLGNMAAWLDGDLVACWGCGGVYMGSVGRPWFLTTPTIKRLPPTLVARIYRHEVEKMQQLFPRLENWVDATYASAVRLLKMTGFTVDAPVAIGHGMYSRFWREG